MNQSKPLLRRPARAAFAAALCLALAACRDDPGPQIPDYVSPEGRQVLLAAWADLANCQDAQVAIIFGEIINFSDPLGQAASMAGQSAGQGKPDLPLDSSLGGVMAIERICCENIERRIDLHSIEFVVPERAAGRMSDKEYRFWRQLSWYVGSGTGQCRLPDPRDSELVWPSG